MVSLMAGQLCPQAILKMDSALESSEMILQATLGEEASSSMQCVSHHMLWCMESCIVCAWPQPFWHDQSGSPPVCKCASSANQPWTRGASPIKQPYMAFFNGP